MLPVTSTGYDNRRHSPVLATAIKQLKRRFGRKVRRAFRTRRLILVGLTFVVLVVWWIFRALQATPIIRVFNVEIEDVDTDILLCGYSDHVMVAVTQTESLGTIYQTRTDTNLDGATTFNIKVLVGNRTDELLRLCARQLAEGLLAAGCSKPLMVCLGLQDLSLQKVRQIVHHVVQHPVW